jgi:nitrogen-specific signal transduction histidine kinase
MSEKHGVNAAANDAAGARLRERQLLLTHATDEKIIDHANTLAETLQFIVDETREILDAWHVDILLRYDDGLRIELSSDRAAEIGRDIPLDQSISGLVLSSGEPIIVSDLQSDPLLRERYFPRVAEDPRGKAPQLSFLAAELTLDRQVIGVINVEATVGNQFSESHLAFVDAVAGLISTAITHAALFDEDTFRAATDRLLMEATTGDTDTVMHLVLGQIMSTLNSLAFVEPDAVDILFADPLDRSRLFVAYSTNSEDIGVRVDIESSICGAAFRTQRTVLLPRALERSEYRPVLKDMRCEMAVPIVFGGSNLFPIGVLNLESSRENAFSVVGRILAERFTRRVVNAIAMMKIRADINTGMQDELLVLAADQVLNSVHRINNHVGSIRALALDLLADVDPQGPPPDLASRLEMIVLEAKHALEIPDHMRRLIATPQVSADVNGQVEAGLVEVRLPQNIALDMELASDLPEIPCTGLDLVVENLVKNAVAAMRDQPGILSVTTEIDRHLPREPFIEVTVRDTGVGMSEAERLRLFEPRPSTRQSRGLGFGMLWVRSWMGRAQGLIDVESTPGEGTTVRLRFQIHPHAAEQLPSEGEAP